jgi:DNA-binding transcriptional MocR family regulator
MLQSMRSLLSAIEERLEHPTSRALATAVSRTVAEGILLPGTKLPPIRTVATELALSPTTVSAAWALLARSGLVSTDGRRGTTVLDTTVSSGSRYRRALHRPTALELDLSTGVPDGALLPRLTGILTSVENAGTPSSYLDPPVLPELAALLRDDWPYVPEELTVVDGAMDALDLVTRSLLRFGDRVVVEHPCFPPLLDLLEALSVEVVGIPVDDEGLDPALLADALESPVAAVMIQPRAQNPAGVTMSPERARRLAALLAPTGALVIEDDSVHGLSPTPALSLGAWLPSHTVHIRSFSKSHGPDLRLAALSGSAELLSVLDTRRHLGQGWSSRLLQRILVGLLTDPAAVAQVQNAAAEYIRRRRLLVDALAEREVPVGGAEGMNIWVPVQDEAAAIVRLASQGIGVSAGAPYAVLPEPRGYIRVTSGLVTAGHEELADQIAAAARTIGWGARAR